MREFSVQRLFFLGVLMSGSGTLLDITVHLWPNPLVLLTGTMTAIGTCVSCAAVRAAFRGR